MKDRRYLEKIKILSESNFEKNENMWQKTHVLNGITYRLTCLEQIGRPAMSDFKILIIEDNNSEKIIKKTTSFTRFINKNNELSKRL